MSNFLKLTQDEEDRLKKSLLDFIQRISSEKSECHEISMFLDIVKLLITANRQNTDLKENLYENKKFCQLVITDEEYEWLQKEAEAQRRSISLQIRYVLSLYRKHQGVFAEKSE